MKAKNSYYPQKWYNVVTTLIFESFKHCLVLDDSDIISDFLFRKVIFMAEHSNSRPFLLIMWKIKIFNPYGCGFFVCMDLNRSRALIVSLKDKNNQIFNVANVHLPVDKQTSPGTTVDRTFARQRELGAIIAKLHFLEQSQSNSQTIPMIIGDFNTTESSIVNLLQNHVVDIWTYTVPDDPGFYIRLGKK